MRTLRPHESLIQLIHDKSLMNIQSVRKRLTPATLSVVLLPLLAAVGFLWVSTQRGHDCAKPLVSIVRNSNGSANDARSAASDRAEDHHHCATCSHPSTVAIRDAVKNQDQDSFAKHFPSISDGSWWEGVAIGNGPIVPHESVDAGLGDKIALDFDQAGKMDGRLIMSSKRQNGTHLFGFELADSAYKASIYHFADGMVSGHILAPGQPLAYQISGHAESGIIIKRVAINQLLCADWNKDAGQVVHLERVNQPVLDRVTQPTGVVFEFAPIHNSLPGSPNVLYLDFDGETVSGSAWNILAGEDPIVVDPASYTPDEITRIWSIVAEDFRGFNVNVTTDRAVFDAASVGSRHMNIFTPTDAWYPDFAGGVAYLDSFYDGSDEPSWTWNEGVRVGALTSSHEIGHAFGLEHDGRTSPAEEYFEGTDDWGPIMGAPFDSPVTQWSKGEYPQANNQFDDDIAVIATSTSLISDDYPNSPASAFILQQDENGDVDVNGIISSDSDSDVFAFSISPGDVTFDISPVGEAEAHNINIRAKVLNSDSVVVADLNPSNSLGVQINLPDLPRGIYYLEVTAGTEGGDDDASAWANGGFGAYGSIGSYSITGNMPQAGLVPSPGDSDGDGLTDDEELTLGTDPLNSDTDQDGLLDRSEVFPFSLVTGAFTYEEATADARQRGGRLAIIDSPEKLYRIRRGLLDAPHPFVILPFNYVPDVNLPNRMWIGGTDANMDGIFRWSNDDGTLDGPEIGAAVLGRIVSGSNLITNVVNVAALTVGRPIIASGLPGGTVISSINPTSRQVTISNPAGNDFTAGVGHVVVVSGGTAYTSPPEVVFDPPGAAADAIIDAATGQVVSVVVTDAGSYTTPPDVYFYSGGGGGAIATAVLTAEGTASVSSFTVTDQGSGYTSPPQVEISGGDADVNATAVASISGGQVVSITVVNPGSGYSTPPTVDFIGGGGTGAAATANMFVPAARIYSPASPQSYNNWNTVLPGNRSNITEAVFLAQGNSFTWGTSPMDSRFGYILERPITNPANIDTDGDGIYDETEFESGTDPTFPDAFAGGNELPAPGGTVDYGAAGVSGIYHGLIYDPNAGHVGGVILRLNRNGRFTYQYSGLVRNQKASGRGEFDAFGTYSGPAPIGLLDVIAADMQLVEHAPGQWAVIGRLSRSNGLTYGFEVRSPQFSRTNPYPSPGRVTMAMSTTGIGLDMPTGDSIATGSISSTGIINLQILMPDGGRASYRGPILNGDFVALHAMSNSVTKLAVVGRIDMNPAIQDRDFSGRLRYHAPADSYGFFPGGIEQMRQVVGSFYVPPFRGTLPIDRFSPMVYNTQFRLMGGVFGGINKVATWSTNNRIEVPITPDDKASLRYSTSTGLLSLNYQLTDQTQEILRTTAKGYAVVLQSPQLVRGFYATALPEGQMELVENDGTIPPITRISPRVKSVPSNQTSYVVQVDTPGAWRVLAPAGTRFYEVEITTGSVDTDSSTDDEDQTDDDQTADGTEEDPALVLNGFGPGVVLITVSSNTTGFFREAVIEIAGVPHLIKQSFLQEFSF